LYLILFEQPASRVFVEILPVNVWAALFDELVKTSKSISSVIPAEVGIQSNEALKTKKHPEARPGMLYLRCLV